MYLCFAIFISFNVAQENFKLFTIWTITFHKEEWFLAYKRGYLQNIYQSRLLQIILNQITITWAMMSRFIIRYPAPQYSYIYKDF